MAKTNRLLGQIDVEHFLSVLGVEFDKPKNNEVNFHCPFPGHSDNDRNPSAYMNTESTAWFCHGCHKKGTAVDFAAELKDVSKFKALQLLREKYDPGYFQSGSTSTKDEVRRILTSKLQIEEDRQPILPEYVLECFQDVLPAAYQYMRKRGFSKVTLDHWEIGYDPYTKRITIPVRDEQNRLIGFKGRALYEDQIPKYLVLGDRAGKPAHYGWQTYGTGHVVFGLAEAILTEDPSLNDSPRHFVVCEGELNAIALWQAGYAGIALSGSNLTKYQQEVIRREADHLTLWFDSDKAGMRALNVSLEAFSPYMPIGAVACDKDAADSTQEEIDMRIKSAESGVKHMLSSIRER